MNLPTKREALINSEEFTAKLLSTKKIKSK